MSSYTRPLLPRAQSFAQVARVTALAAAMAALVLGCSMPEMTEKSASNVEAEQSTPHARIEEFAAEPLSKGPLSSAPDPSYAALLMRKARELAESELGRMSAAELTYRNTVSFQELTGAQFVGGTGNYMKAYRSFDEYIIRDIYRSESYVFPVTVEIEFKHKFLHTKVRPSMLPNAESTSQSDTRFEVAGTYALTRRYRCDGDGNYTGQLPELPPRPNYYRRGRDQILDPDPAPANRMPPGGQGFQTLSPAPPPMNSMPRAPGGSFP